MDPSEKEIYCEWLYVFTGLPYEHWIEQTDEMILLNYKIECDDHGR